MKQPASEDFDKLAFMESVIKNGEMGSASPSPSEDLRLISASPTVFPSRTPSLFTSQSAKLFKSPSTSQKPPAAAEKEEKPIAEPSRARVVDTPIVRQSSDAMEIDVAESEDKSGDESESDSDGGPQENLWGDEAYEVDGILAHRYFVKDDVMKYLVKWDGVDANGEPWDVHLASTWEPEEHFSDPLILEQYFAQVQEAREGGCKPFNLEKWETERTEKLESARTKRPYESLTYYGEYITAAELNTHLDGLDRSDYGSDEEAEEVRGMTNKTRYRDRNGKRSKLSKSEQAKIAASQRNRILEDRKYHPSEQYIRERKEEQHRRNKAVRRRKDAEVKAAAAAAAAAAEKARTSKKRPASSLTNAATRTTTTVPRHDFQAATHTTSSAGPSRTSASTADRPQPTSGPTDRAPSSVPPGSGPQSRTHPARQNQPVPQLKRRDVPFKRTRQSRRAPVAKKKQSVFGAFRRNGPTASEPWAQGALPSGALHRADADPRLEGRAGAVKRRAVGNGFDGDRVMPSIEW